MRRLHPDPGPVDPEPLICGLRLGDRAPADRPYTIVNFVSSVDGRASLKGGSTGLGDTGDRAIFRTLRACADAVLAGTGTLAAEHYGLLVRTPQAREVRARLGLEPQPLAVAVTRSGSLPEGVPLLADPAARVVVYSGAALDLEAVEADVDVVRMAPEAMTMAAVLADLRARHGVSLLLCEGGPTVFGRLVAEGVADELFLTLAPKLAGAGDAITRGLELPDPRDLQLRWVLEQDGSLYLRYALNR